jgi:hypothetical protein
MAGYLLLFSFFTILSLPVHAQKISQAEFESLRGECVAVDASGRYASADHKNATNQCLSACPENLRIHNNRALTLCMGAHTNFKRLMPKKPISGDAPISQVTGKVDYQGHHAWALTSTNNVEVSKHCSRIVLSAAEANQAPLKGHQMMISGIKEEPVIAVPTSAVLINVRLPSNEERLRDCTAEVIHLLCQAHEADRAICNP